MLILQRASAGSGKTFTLTKQYLTHLLTIVDQNTGEVRLRTEAEIVDAVEHILAVTFTNKATNEMKQRILSRLNALAFPPADPDKLKKVDYLKFFTDEFGASVEQVSRLAKIALREVLYQYSNFNISTIDTFFQVILRTFAYESDLPDGYNLVIESNYLSQMAVRDLIDDFAQRRLSTRLTNWLRSLVRNNVINGTNSWSVFQRKEGGKYSTSLFNSMVKMGDDLDKEEYKEVKESIDEFYASDINLYESAEKINKQLADALEEKYASVAEAARVVKSVFEDIAADGNVKVSKKLRDSGYDWKKLIYSPRTTSKAIGSLIAGDFEDIWELPLVKAPKSPEKVFASDLKDAGADAGRAIEAVAALIQAQEEYLALRKGEECELWRLIQPGLPRVEVMYDIKQRVSDYLADNDAMKLADTNTILHRIIADDDVPFIYERIGTRINHYLIDEFQDTSKMQWTNFRPLLSESLGKGNENLIIGDAKQSIYRFRSADPTLITTTVTDTFAKSEVEVRGYSEAENTNWRSKRNVVEFNNYFFYALSRYLDSLYATDVPIPLLADLYSNTVQNPHHKEDEGYVRIECVGGEPEDGDAEGAKQGESDGIKSGDKISAAVVDRIGNLIISLLERGYSQKHIAILVATNQAGAEIIAGLMEFNNNNRNRMPQLKFVSDDSLMLSRCRAVREVVECFRMIQSGIEEDRPVKEDSPEGGAATEAAVSVDSGDKKVKNNKINWSEVGHKFNYYMSRHPELSITEAIRDFLKEGVDYDMLDAMMSEMQAVTLPSLTETLIERFVGPDVKPEDAPFLAAFQDAVLDYCESNPADVGSFLKWWDARGKRICISSPEGMEAINVMTIHASKGLEFECVIIPDVNTNFQMKNTWRWLQMPDSLSYRPLIPGYLPVEIKRTVSEKTTYQPYKEEYASQQYMHEVDQLNKVYVGFTRAASELYIYLPPQSGVSSKNYLNNMIPAILGNMAEQDQTDTDTEKVEADDYLADAHAAGVEHIPQPGSIRNTPGDEWGIYEYGRPVSDVPAMLNKEKKTEDQIDTKETRDLYDYKVFSSKEILQYHPEDKEPRCEPGEEDREDPRSEGTLLHNVLEFVRKEADLRNAFERMRVKGRITREFIDRHYPMLENALADVADKGWFGGRYIILAERPVFDLNDKTRRPDRIMIDNRTGECVVVDYKFGEVPDNNSHNRQVSGYVDKLKRSGNFSSVEGYIWYVKERKIVKVS